MKRAPVTAALTLAGVLTAGTATALVNSHVLDITDTQATETNRVRLPALPTTTTTSTPTTSTAGRVVAVTTVPEPPVPVTSPTATTPPAVDTTIPQLVDVPAGEAGIVTVQLSPEGFQVVAATPNDGWILDTDDGADVTTTTLAGSEVPPPSVRFRRADGDERVECELRLVDGQVVGHIRGDDDGDDPTTTAPATDPTTATTAPAPPTSEPERGDDDRRDDDDRQDDERRSDDDDDRRDDDWRRDRDNDQSNDGGDRRPGWGDDD